MICPASVEGAAPTPILLMTQQDRGNGVTADLVPEYYALSSFRARGGWRHAVRVKQRTLAQSIAQRELQSRSEGAGELASVVRGYRKGSSLSWTMHRRCRVQSN